MKELLHGFLMIISAIIIFTIPILSGAVYQVGHAFVMAYAQKDFLVIPKNILKQIDGTLSCFGNILKCIAINYDILANVHGEWLEDAITAEEITPLGEKEITMSASIGYIKHNNKTLFTSGKILDQALNFVFDENDHTLGSWLKKLKYDNIQRMNLRKRRKFKPNKHFNLKSNLS